MKKRCQWVEGTFDAYVQYHDREWGVPVADDKVLFEFLILEGAQAGLSWSTILNRREGYRRAFSDWDVYKVAAYDENKVQQLMQDTGIVRNQLKIRATITNAQCFIKVMDEFDGFNKYLWSFVDGNPIHNGYKLMKEVPAKTKLSDKLSKDLKTRGFKFVGSTIVYAYMQAVGLVNDHTADCFRYQEILDGKF